MRAGCSGTVTSLSETNDKQMKAHYETKNSNLSLAASAVRRIERSHAEAAEADAGFDGGEFSGPAHGRMVEDEITQALKPLGFTPRTYNMELDRRGCGRFAYVNGIYAPTGHTWETDRWEFEFNERDCSGAFDGNRVTSDADEGL
jgi:hypothetical protein